MNELIQYLKESKYNKLFYTEWYIDAHGINCRFALKGKNRKQKAKIICEQLNKLMTELREGRIQEGICQCKFSSEEEANDNLPVDGKCKICSLNWQI